VCYDETNYFRVSYSIHGGDGLGSFYVDGTGNIKTSVVLDRESKKSYWITIVAQVCCDQTLLYLM